MNPRNHVKCPGAPHISLVQSPTTRRIALGCRPAPRASVSRVRRDFPVFSAPREGEVPSSRKPAPPKADPHGYSEMGVGGARWGASWRNRDLIIGEDLHRPRAPSSWPPLAPSRTPLQPPRGRREGQALASRHSAGCRLMEMDPVQIEAHPAAACADAANEAAGRQWAPWVPPQDTEQPLHRAPGSWACGAGASTQPPLPRAPGPGHPSPDTRRADPSRHASTLLAVSGAPPEWQRAGGRVAREFGSAA